MTRFLLVSIPAALLALGLVGPARAGEPTVVRGHESVCFVFPDGKLAERLTKQDLFFLGLELRRRVFQQFGPLSQAEQEAPVVVLPDSSTAQAAELDQAIARLGRLIREAERAGTLPR